jgi:hypothetical protein
MSEEQTTPPLGGEPLAVEPPEAMPPAAPTPLAVLKVMEGVRGPAAAGRIFSVVLSGPADDLAIVATARDPKSGLAIPAEGSAHPDEPALVARPPLIFPVGRRDKQGGALLAARSNFYNVRIPYVARPPEAT